MPPTRLRHIHSLAIHNLHLPQHASTTTTTTATRKVSISNSKLNSDYEDVSQPPSLSTSQNNTTNNNNSNSNKVSWEKFAHSLVVDANLLCDVWFEISCENGHVFRSDVIRKTLNPIWQPLDFGPNVNLTNLTTFTFKLYARSVESTSKPYTRVLKRIIDLSLDLETTSSSSSSSSMNNLPPNTVVVTLMNGEVCLLSSSSDDGKNGHQDLPEQHRILTTKIKPSYRLEALKRILLAQKEIYSLSVSLMNDLETAELKLKQRNDMFRKRKTVLAVKTRVNQLENRIVEETRGIEFIDKARLKDLLLKLDTRRQTLGDAQAKLFDLRRRRQQQDDDDDLLLGQQLRKLSSINRVLQRDVVVKELMTIWPIRPVENSRNVLLYEIRGVVLPNSEYAGYDTDLIATALGYTSHFLVMIASYLEMPLRYPIKPMSSKSCIMDRCDSRWNHDDVGHLPSIPATHPLSALTSFMHPNTELPPQHYKSSLLAPNEFPLYSRHVDRFRFDYAVFLLNKNVEQLCHYLGVTVVNLKNTLPNLKMCCEVVEESYL